MRHTPGPWIRSKHGFNVLTADSMQSICAVHAIHPGHSNEKDAQEQIANAQLIADAPDILAALRDLYKWGLKVFPSEGHKEEKYRLLQTAEDLIKANR
jgi:hypothetical protein